MFHKILESELPDHLKSDKKTMTSNTSRIRTSELRLMFQGVSANISPDLVNLLMEDANVMKQLARLLPILDVGKKGGLGYAVQPNSFDEERESLADAVGTNGNLRQIMRNLRSIETSADTVEGESSSDADAEYADADEETNRVSRQSYYSRKLSGQGKPDQPSYHEPRDHNVNGLAALLAMNVREKLKREIIERSSTNHDQHTHYKPRSGCLLTTMVVPSGSKGNHETGYESAGNAGSSYQSKIDLDESGNENDSLEKWESAIEPNLINSSSEARNNTRTHGEVIHKRTLSMESSCLCARTSIQSSYSSLAGDGGSLGELPTISNQDNDGYELLYNRESISGRNILNQCKTINRLLEDGASAVEPIHQMEQGTRSFRMQDDITYEREVSCERRYPSACPSLQFSYKSASSVGIDGSLDVDKAVVITQNKNESGAASREDIHEKCSLEIWSSPIELNVQSTKKSNADESKVAGRKDCDETNIHPETTLENWESANGLNHLNCIGREPGNTSLTEHNIIIENTSPRYSLRPPSHKKTLSADNDERCGDEKLTAWTDLRKESAWDTCKEIVGVKNSEAFWRTTQATETAQSRSQSSSKPRSKYSAESLHKNTSSVPGKGSVQGVQGHAFPKVMAFQTALFTDVSSEMGESSEAGDENVGTEATRSHEISEGLTISKSRPVSLTGFELKNSATEQLYPKARTSLDCSKLRNASHEITVVVSQEQLSSHLQCNQENSQADRILIKPDVSRSIRCASIGVGTTITQSTSDQESQLLGCSTWETVCLTRRITDPNRSGRQGVDVGCGTRLGKLLQPTKPENVSAQPESLNERDPMLIKSLITYTRASDSEISQFSPTIATLLGDSQESEDDKGIVDLSRLQSDIHEGKDGRITENQEIFNKNIDSSISEVLDGNYDETLCNDTVAMIVLSSRGKNVNADASSRTSGSIVDEILSRPGEVDGSNQANLETTPELPSDTSGAGSLSGLRRQEPVPNRSQSLKASNIAVPEPNNSKSKKTVALNLPISKSLEDVIHVTSPSKEGRYNLRKRPQQRVDTSQSGPIMNASLEGYGKRLRTCSPGVPAPSPFRLSEASPSRSTRARHPRTNRSTCLRAPNLEERLLRKRPNQEPNQDLTDSEDEPPPIKKAKTSNGSPHKAGTSAPPGHSSAAGNRTPVSSSSGSGSSLGRSSLNRTTRIPKGNRNTSEHPSHSEDSSPRCNLRRRSDPMKTEDEQQTEPVRIREIRKTGPETRVRARNIPHNPMPRVQRTVDRSNRDQSQNTRPVLIEDKKGSKSKTKDRKPSEPDENPQP